MKEFDYVIIGGGCAGLSLAYELDVHQKLNKNNMENYKNSGKIYVSNFGKINQTFLSIFDLIKLIFMKSGEHIRKDEHSIINEQINLDERI